MDDNSYSETDANATAPDAPPGALIVAATNLTGNDASKFSGCYFVINGTSWSLVSKNGTIQSPLATGTATETGFTFNHDLVRGSNSTKIVWTTSSLVYTMSQTTPPVITKIVGGWSNDDGDGPADAPPSGTFQASSSGTVDVVSASASASAS